MTSSQIQKAFCTTREAAEILGVSVGTVQLWVEGGVLEAWKTTGGHRRVMRDSIHRLLHGTPTGSAAKAAAARAEPPGRLRILILEDDLDLLRLYQLNLARWPMAPEVCSAENAFAALMMLGRERFDLMISDLHMKDMDGFSMLRVIAADEDAARMKIVVVTGLDPAAIAARGGVPAGIEILPKPVPFARLQQIAQTIRA